jgi:hypothetical protein
MIPRFVTGSPSRETWQGAYQYEVLRLDDWFWRVELDGRLVATVTQMHGQWRGWVQAICLTLTQSPKASEDARREVIKKVIGYMEA